MQIPASIGRCRSTVMSAPHEAAMLWIVASDASISSQDRPRLEQPPSERGSNVRQRGRDGDSSDGVMLATSCSL